MSVTTDDGHVTIRMYNVGFGDAFLIVLPGPDRPARMLVDCGSHFLSARPRPVAETVAQIIEDVTEDDGVPRIDVVVGTHRHQDHVSGFHNKAWSKVEVGEVWMPWTEHPTDPKARKVRETQSSAAKHLSLALERLGADDETRGLAENNLTNTPAMATLHRGFSGSPERRFLPDGERMTVLESPALPGVKVHVLGPSHDDDVIRDMNPPAGESYLRLLGATAEGGAHRPPFPPHWAMTVDEFDAMEPPLPHLSLDKRDRDRVTTLAGVDGFQLAVALEAAVNGTSLMFMLEVGEAMLLFPGDAQWGTWRRALADPDTAELLSRTTFLKVGHHGSHNATPKDFVEALTTARASGDQPPPDMWAMVSTHPISVWKAIPKQELLKALGNVTPQLARSDHGDGAAVVGFSDWGENVIEARVPIA
jgi:beta-lactamase superfamily II metal-dependent hydrolase